MTVNGCHQMADNGHHMVADSSLRGKKDVGSNCRLNIDSLERSMGTLTLETQQEGCPLSDLLLDKSNSIRFAQSCRRKVVTLLADRAQFLRI